MQIWERCRIHVYSFTRPKHSTMGYVRLAPTKTSKMYPLSFTLRARLPIPASLQNQCQLRSYSNAPMQESQAEVYRRTRVQMRREHGLQLINLLSPEGNNKVLDFGCGTGYLTNVLAERVRRGGRVVGVDTDEKCLKLAKQEYGKRIRFVKGDVKAVAGSRFDLVFANYVMHWVKDKANLFRAIHQSLEPWGRFGFNAVGHLPKIAMDMCYLMGKEEGRALVRKYWYMSAEEYSEIATSTGYIVDYKTLTTQRPQWPNIDSLLEWWFSVLQGTFDSASIDKTVLESFKQPYGDKPVDLEAPLLTMILRKAQQ